MKVLIVYDSVFGNTKEVAMKLAEAMEGEVVVQHVSEATLPTEFDLLIVGSPTRAFQPTKDITNYVKKLNPWSGSIAFFDTRMDIDTVDNKFLKQMAKWFGYANDSLEKRAAKRHLNLLLPSGEFFVKDTEGPLYEVEPQRILEWSSTIQSKWKGNNTI